MRAPRPPLEGAPVVIGGLPRIYINRQVDIISLSQGSSSLYVQDRHGKIDADRKNGASRHGARKLFRSHRSTRRAKEEMKFCQIGKICSLRHSCLTFQKMHTVGGLPLTRHDATLVQSTRQNAMAERTADVQAHWTRP